MTVYCEVLLFIVLAALVYLTVAYFKHLVPFEKKTQSDPSQKPDSDSNPKPSPVSFSPEK
jgi:hypothetical protein